MISLMADVHLKQSTQCPMAKHNKLLMETFRQSEGVKDLTSLVMRKRNIFQLETLNALRNRESNISTFEIIFLLSIHRHHDVLLVANGVGGRNRTRHSGQLVFPQYFSCLLIKRTEHIVAGGADEDQTSCGSNSSAAVEHAGICNTHLFEFRVFAEWNLPHDVARVQVDGSHCTERRGDGRITFGIKIKTVSIEAIRFIVLRNVCCFE